MKNLLSLLVLPLLVYASAAVADLRPECPRHATTQAVEDPAAWADDCFEAVAGRAPDPARHETQTRMQDIDLDGRPERLEIRGTGQKLKQIYVFRPGGGKARYLGRLDAHPGFMVVPGSDGRATLLNVYTRGANVVVMQQIKHLEGEFRVVEQTRLR